MRSWIGEYERIRNFYRLSEEGKASIGEGYDKLQALGQYYHDKGHRARSLRESKDFAEFREKATAIMLEIALVATEDIDVFQDVVSNLPKLIVEIYSDFASASMGAYQYGQLSDCIRPYLFEMAIRNPDLTVILNTIFDAITQGNYDLQSTSGIELMYGLLEHSKVDTRAVSLAEMKLRPSKQYYAGLDEMAKRLKANSSNKASGLGKSSIFGS